MHLGHQKDSKVISLGFLPLTCVLCISLCFSVYVVFLLGCQSLPFGYVMAFCFALFSPWRLADLSTLSPSLPKLGTGSVWVLEMFPLPAGTMLSLASRGCKRGTAGRTEFCFWFSVRVSETGKPHWANSWSAGRCMAPGLAPAAREAFPGPEVCGAHSSPSVPGLRCTRAGNTLWPATSPSSNLFLHLLVPHLGSFSGEIWNWPPVRGGQGETEERGRPLQTARCGFNKPGDLLSRFILGGHRRVDLYTCLPES